MKEIIAVYLCGGIGKRMFPITTDKTLIPFNGTPLIIHQINSTIKAGLRQFIFICNKSNYSELKSLIQKIPRINVEFIIQQNALGIANALISASDRLYKKPFILISPNDIVDPSAYIEILREYSNNENYCSYILAREVTSYFPGGYLIINKQNEIIKIVEKPEPGKEPSRLINIVLHLHLHPENLFNYLKAIQTQSDDLYETTLNSMIDDKYKMKAIIYKHGWQSIKYPWHILEAMDYFLKKIRGKISHSADVSDKAIIDGKVFIAKGAKILEGAVIRGPSYIGDNTVVGNNCLIRNSQIGSNCIIGYNTEIKHSYIGSNCFFHYNYIGDSVIENNCLFGAGTITANYRFDKSNISLKIDGKNVDTGHNKLGAFIGRDCNFGVNTSLMPGIRIGPNKTIPPNTCIHDDIN